MAAPDADGQAVLVRSKAKESTFHFGLSRFLEEGRTLAHLCDRSVACVHRVGDANNTAYLVMNLEEGMTLAQNMRAGPMPELEVLTILRSLLRGLAVVHDQHVLHRVIKPDNIIIRANGTPVEIDFDFDFDFGAVRALLQCEAGMTVICTSDYAPIEKYGDGEPQGPWIDLYALGATMRHCLLDEAPSDAMRRNNAIHFLGLANRLVKLSKTQAPS